MKMTNIKKHLLPNEKILAQTVAADLVELYATNKRVIRYEYSRFGETVESLTYSSIVSVDLVRRRRVRHFIAGVLMLFIAPILSNFHVVISLLILVIAIILIISGFRWMSYYQIRALGLPESEMKRWRTYNDSGQDVLEFAKAVQAQIVKNHSFNL
jgi:hypothetical protein